VKALSAVDRWLFSARRPFSILLHERAMEAGRSIPVHVKEWARIGWDPDTAAAHRERPAAVRGAVPHSADVGARRRADDRLSRWGDLAVTRRMQEPVSDPRSADDVSLRVVRTLSARAALGKLLPVRRAPVGQDQKQSRLDRHATATRY
jgi:hypothetical protein